MMVFLNLLTDGLLSNFIKMMYSDSYFIMINHKKHNINLVEQGVNISFFLVELVDKTDDKFKFQWIVEKYSNEYSTSFSSFLGLIIFLTIFSICGTNQINNKTFIMLNIVWNIAR